MSQAALLQSRCCQPQQPATHAGCVPCPRPLALVALLRHRKARAKGSSRGGGRWTQPQPPDPKPGFRPLELTTRDDPSIGGGPAGGGCDAVGRRVNRTAVAPELAFRLIGGCSQAIDRREPLVNGQRPSHRSVLPRMRRGRSGQSVPSRPHLETRTGTHTASIDRTALFGFGLISLGFQFDGLCVCCL